MKYAFSYGTISTNIAPLYNSVIAFLFQGGQRISDVSLEERQLR